MCGENGGKWKKYLPLVALADRISTKRTTGFSPYEVQFGKLPVLPIEIETRTFLAVELHTISTTEDILEARENQLEVKKQQKNLKNQGRTQLKIGAEERHTN
ncbi:hypothetical protein O181_007293 [Austropuccinia psidii MF-1]|uniref:Uncharacterized protein n=1 Tax=Austropuccinia psidii MF-1 TaxID=1389203 RepID=A0A9Q3BM47_9BASI|nr:hypothetical protein [Austropuccinia psidii MF-1]